MSTVAAHHSQNAVVQKDDINLSSSSFAPNLKKLVDTVTFGSRSEAACAYMMEMFLPNFRAIQGVTCQIEIGSRQVDFRVGNTFVEFHPFVLRRAFIKEGAYKQYESAIRNLSGDVKRHLTGALEKEFSAQYYKQRRILLDGVPEYRDCRLVLCTNTQEFFKFLRQYAQQKLPDNDQLHRIFDEACRF